MSTPMTIIEENLHLTEDNLTQYLTFEMAREVFGVDVQRIQEIKGWETVTHIPNSPEFVKGVINIRGEIVPIIDLRIRFELAKPQYTDTTVIIVLRIENEHERTVGLVVDAVSDVCVVNEEDIKPAPDFGLSLDTSFVSGLVTLDSKMVLLMEIDNLFRLAILNEILDQGNEVEYGE